MRRPLIDWRQLGRRAIGLLIFILMWFAVGVLWSAAGCTSTGDLALRIEKVEQRIFAVEAQAAGRDINAVWPYVAIVLVIVVAGLGRLWIWRRNRKRHGNNRYRQA